jgi:hypothetical protein
MCCRYVLPGMAEANHWTAAAAFATVMSTAVGLCTAWWAGRERSWKLSPGPRSLRAHIAGGGPGEIVQGVIIKAGAYDQAQMPVLGQGNQHNTFGADGAPQL